MSHIEKIELEITDLSCLIKAGEALGMTHLADAKTFRGWMGKEYACDSRFNLPGTDYQLGVHRKGKAYELAVDFYHPVVRKTIGEKGGKLKQAYAVETACKAARKQGLQFKKTVLSDGSVRLTVGGAR